ncbi:endonuclease/exonuclease/phosphatase family protein [Chitinivorax sp. B]|uniref:endonuclease/exonuclease/phosphatase family protein n=1 Tax=Chitinivorax sp. B TaxID=2502235 RepID=UPI0010F7B920|nr:endonuclease/exonuclease/phosphatase family protein [Chitinivorax sp. B]
MRSLVNRQYQPKAWEWRLLVLIVLPPVLSWFASWHWLLDVLTSFVPYYLLACLLGAVWWVWRRFIGLALLCLIVSAVMAVQIGLAMSPSLGTPVATAPTIKVAQFNISLLNPNLPAFFSWLNRKHADTDIVVLLEAGPALTPLLASMKSHYPYQSMQLDDSPFGIAMLSRLPDTHLELVNDSFPYIEAQVNIAGRTLHVIGVHPPPPISGSLTQARNHQLQQLAQRVSRQAPDSVIVVGDFNITPWSPWYRRFLEESGLHAANQQWQPTWAPYSSEHWRLVPIDLTFHSDKVNLLARQVGPAFESDHRVVISTWQLSARVVTDSITWPSE